MQTNWQKLKQRMPAPAGGKKRKMAVTSVAPASERSSAPSTSVLAEIQSESEIHLRRSAPAPAVGDKPLHAEAAATPRLALDCEMVGVGIDGKRSALARIVIVGWDERVVYSAFVRPREAITDFRTHVSGIRPDSMRHALPLKRVQDDVAKLLHERILIGHALHNDLRALELTHPKERVRDTAHYPPYRLQQADGLGSRPRALRHLAKDFLGWEIQGGAHSPAEDAVAALRLYKLKMSEWERALPKAGGGTGGSGGARLGGSAAHQTSKWEIALAKGKKPGRKAIHKQRKLDKIKKRREDPHAARPA